MAEGTSVVSDRWGTSAGPRALRERSQYASRLRLPAAAEDIRNCSPVSPRAGRLPSGRGPNADRPFDEPATSTARRVAAATWMMSSTTVASRAYAVVPARRSRWSRGGASRPSSAPAAGSARHRADASRRDRAARSPDPQPASCRRPFRRGFRARAAPSTRHRWCPRPDQQPLSGCVGRDVLAGACVPTPGPAGAVPVRVRSRSSAGLRWTRGRLWHPRRQHRPLRTGLASGDRCKGRRFGAGRMYVPGILSSQPSQVCLPSHGTVPERRANVQKGARLRGTDRRCSAPFRGSAGRRKDAGTRWLGCCPPEMSTGETHPRAKRPMNRAKTPLRRRAAPRGRPLRGTRYFHAQSRRQAAPTDSGSPEDVRPALDLRVPPVPAHSCRGTGSDVRPQCAWGPYVPGGVGSTGAARCAARPHALELGRRAGMVRLREHGPDDVAAGGSGRAFRSEAASRSSRRQRSD